MERLDKLVADKSFDLYAQSPWVTGSYISAVVTHIMFTGLQLLNKQGYLTRLLHVYNMIQQLGGTGFNIPILEHLCDLLAPAVFIDADYRPTDDFSKKMQIALSLIFIGDDEKLSSRATLKPSINPFTKHARIKTMSLSGFASESLFNHYILSDKVLAKLTDERFLARKHNVKATILTRYSPSDLVLRAKSLLLLEFEGPFPLARLNYFAVTGLVLDVWKEIAIHVTKPDYPGLPVGIKRFYKTEKKLKLEYITKEHVDSATTVAFFVMSAVDDVVRERCTGWRKDAQQLEGVCILRDAIVKVCGDVKVEDFLWKDI